MQSEPLNVARLSVGRRAKRMCVALVRTTGDMTRVAIWLHRMTLVLKWRERVNSVVSDLLVAAVVRRESKTSSSCGRGEDRDVREKRWVV